MAPMRKSAQAGGMKQFTKAMGEAFAAFSGASGGRSARKTGVDKPEWPCRFKDCAVAQSGRANFGTRTSCRGCGRQKQNAMNPPLVMACAPAEPTTSTRQRAAKKDPATVSAGSRSS